MEKEILAMLKEMQGDIRSIKDDVSTLKSDVSTLKSDVHDLQKDMSNVKDEISQIKSNMATKEDLAQLGTQVFQALEETEERLKTEINTGEKLLNERLFKVEKKVLN